LTTYKQHGFFADNTPLSNSDKAPPYYDAFDIFVSKIRRNLNIIERFYGFLLRNSFNPESELSKVKVLNIDVRKITPDILNLKPNTLPAIITSPPYLCMSDYVLGQRLSYYWLNGSSLAEEFKIEIGARRGRTNPDEASRKYFEDMNLFALNAHNLLRKGGILAMVLAAPVAKAFKNLDVISKIDSIFLENGFNNVWKKCRKISWHRNQGYQKLREERLSVHINE
jgi:hypothetical protein